MWRPSHPTMHTHALRSLPSQLESVHSRLVSAHLATRLWRPHVLYCTERSPVLFCFFVL